MGGLHSGGPSHVQPPNIGNGQGNLFGGIMANPQGGQLAPPNPEQQQPGPPNHQMPQPLGPNPPPQQPFGGPYGQPLQVNGGKFEENRESIPRQAIPNQVAPQNNRLQERH